MTNNEFIKLALRTESDPGRVFPNLTTFSDNKIRLLHAAMGLATESGELLDAFKKHIFYGSELDVVNVKEELGDMLWYIAIACKAMDVQLEELMDMTIRKLKVRYPEKFCPKKAAKRNLKKERKVLGK